MLTFTYLFSTESTAPALHWQPRRTDGGSCPKNFFFQFSSKEQLYFSYSSSDYTVCWHSQEQSWGTSFKTSWGPEDFPLREEFQCTCVLTVPTRLHLHCQRNIDPNTALTLPRHPPTKNIKAAWMGSSWILQQDFPCIKWLTVKQSQLNKSCSRMSHCSEIKTSCTCRQRSLPHKNSFLQLPPFLILILKPVISFCSSLAHTRAPKARNLLC